MVSGDKVEVQGKWKKAVGEPPTKASEKGFMVGLLHIQSLLITKSPGSFSCTRHLELAHLSNLRDVWSTALPGKAQHAFQTQAIFTKKLKINK